MSDSIELLGPSLLGDTKKLKEIDWWLNVINRSNGWHYDLDIVWLLKKIEGLGVPRGATIIDAGAGLGVMQYILAARGYHVVSLDFAERSVPRFCRGIFHTEERGVDLSDYHHEYRDFIDYTKGAAANGQGTPLSAKLRKLANPAAVLHSLGARWFSLRQRLHAAWNVWYALERARDHAGFGDIVFLKGTFNAIPLADSTADLLVSVSAFEHNTYQDMPASIAEFARVLKQGAPMLITTAAAEENDWYYEPCKGWCISEKTLAAWFGIGQDRIAFDYGPAIEELRHCAALKARVSEFYRYSERCGLPYARLDMAQYVPVGIVKVKP